MIPRSGAENTRLRLIGLALGLSFQPPAPTSPDASLRRVFTCVESRRLEGSRRSTQMSTGLI